MYSLLLAGDLDKNGALGQKTIQRLEAFLMLPTKRTLLLTGGFIQNYPAQKESLAILMQRYLRKRQFSDVIVLPATGSLGTYSELKKYYAFTKAKRVAEYEIISTAYHIPRTKLLVRKHFGQQVYARTNFVSVPADKPSLKEILLLEPIKYFCLLIPLQWQLTLTKFAHRLGLRFSW